MKAAHISEVGSGGRHRDALFGLIKSRWVARHTLYGPPRAFEDIQLSGPSAAGVTATPSSRTPRRILARQIEYEPPLGPLGKLAAPFLVRTAAGKSFAYARADARLVEKQTV